MIKVLNLKKIKGKDDVGRYLLPILEDRVLSDHENSDVRSDQDHYVEK